MKKDARTLMVMLLVGIIVIAWALICVAIGGQPGWFIFLMGVLVGAIIALVNISEFLPPKSKKKP